MSRDDATDELIALGQAMIECGHGPTEHCPQHYRPCPVIQTLTYVVDLAEALAEAEALSDAH